MYKKQEVYDNALEYYHDDLAANVWTDKYCLKNSSGKLMEKSPLDMYKRLANEFARIENKYPNPIDYDKIYELLKEQFILPGGSLLYGIGNNYSYSSLGNCFVVGNDADSYGGIFTTDQEQAQLMKRRAGVGHDISHLRPFKAPVSNSAQTSTGAVSFMPRFSNTTREVAQDGRRGALMLTCNINHPNSLDFIKSKSDRTKITGANISVKVDDVFMKAVENNSFIIPKNPYKIKVDETTSVSFSVTENAKKLWKELVHQAWDNAEPGVLFWDKIKSESIPRLYGKEWEETSTNPCGEIPLCPYDSCRLLSVNLTKFVKNPFTKGAYFDWEEFDKVVRIAQKLMDDVVDLEAEKIDRILEKVKSDPEDEEIKRVEINLWKKVKKKLLEGRRTGLSGIGLADTLAMLNSGYIDGISIAEEVYKQLAISAYKSSIDMAKDRGAFPIWDIKKENTNPFLERIFNELDNEPEGAWSWDQEKWNEYGRRNIALLTIPPSGTISLLAGISSGIEPVYQLSYKRRRKVDVDHPNKSFQDATGDWWEEYIVLHLGAERWAIDNHINTDDLESIKKCPYIGSTAYELNPIDRVKMQGVIQKWVDHSISSTINLPKEATEEDVANIYMTAWKEGLKGVTIYRDGSRDGVLVSNESNKKTKFVTNNAPKRPKYMPCDIFTPTTHGQQYVVAVGIIEDQPYEVFAFKFDGKFILDKGYIKKVNRGRYDITDLEKVVYSEDITSEMSQVEEDKTRLISWGLRHGGGIKFLVEQLNKAKGNGFQSFSRVIARTLKRYIKDNDKVTGATCENCGSTNLIYKDGCVECESCGVQKC